MSFLELFENHADVLDHEFIESVDLDHLEENVVQDIMAEISIPLTIEEEISELQLNGLLDLDDHSGLPSMPGIQATDVGSLLEQFEEVSQTLTDCDSLEPTFDSSQNSEMPVEDKSGKKNILKEKKEMTSEVLERLKAANKRKTAVMLPMGVPAKRGRGRAMPRGRPITLPANCTPLRLQRVMMQNKELSDSLPLVTPDIQSVSKDKLKDDSSKANENYFELTLDHDYCKTRKDPSEQGQKEEDIKEAVSKDKENNNVRTKDTGVLFSLADTEDGELIDNMGCAKSDTVLMNSCNTWSKRNYRKQRAESPVVDSGQYFDKIPTYYTALSIPKKPMRRSASDSIKTGLCFQDFLERDVSPARDTSAYSKLPDYYSTFTNSTKYDKNGNYSQESKTSSGYSSRSQSPSVIDSARHSRSRSPSYIRSAHRHDRSVSSRRDPSRNRSFSSGSRYSSCRSCSTSRSRSRSVSSLSSRSHSSSGHSSCSSRSSSSCSSRSRSLSKDRGWRRERNIRGSRSRRNRSFSRFSLSSSRSLSRSRSRRASHSRHRSPSYSRSRSRSRFRSRSRYRSRSRSFSRSRHFRRRSRSSSRRAHRRNSRDRIREEVRHQIRKEKVSEMRKQNSERRIVYVGCIPDDYTRRKLHRRFEKFGEIENVQLHFREHGDNYGFVTFAYTCDAYAAIEKGNSSHDDVKLDLCFGGRRQFCDEEYADLDGNKEMEEEFDTEPRKANSFDFDELLKQARAKIKKS